MYQNHNSLTVMNLFNPRKMTKLGSRRAAASPMFVQSSYPKCRRIGRRRREKKRAISVPYLGNCPNLLSLLRVGFKGDCLDSVAKSIFKWIFRCLHCRQQIFLCFLITYTCLFKEPRRNGYESMKLTQKCLMFMICSLYRNENCPLPSYMSYSPHRKLQPEFHGPITDIHCNASPGCSAVSCGWRMSMNGFVERWGKGEGRKSSRELLGAAFLDVKEGGGMMGRNSCGGAAALSEFPQEGEKDCLSCHCLLGAGTLSGRDTK